MNDAEHDDTRHGDREIHTGEIYGKSPLTGAYYRITRWTRQDDKRVTARSKEQIDRDEVPDEWIEQLDADVNEAEQQ